MNQERLILRSYRITADASPIVTCVLCRTDFGADVSFRDAWVHLKLTHRVHGEEGYYGARAESPIAFTLLQRQRR